MAQLASPRRSHGTRVINGEVVDAKHKRSRGDQPAWPALLFLLGLLMIGLSLSAWTVLR